MPSQHGFGKRNFSSPGPLRVWLLVSAVDFTCFFPLVKMYVKIEVHVGFALVHSLVCGKQVAVK